MIRRLFSGIMANFSGKIPMKASNSARIGNSKLLQEKRQLGKNGRQKYSTMLTSLAKLYYPGLIQVQMKQLLNLWEITFTSSIRNRFRENWATLEF